MGTMKCGKSVNNHLKSNSPTATSGPEIFVYCPKDKHDVPVWFCLGSFMQQRKPCPHLIEMTVYGSEKKAKVKCGWKENEQV